MAAQRKKHTRKRLRVSPVSRECMYDFARTVSVLSTVLMLQLSIKKGHWLLLQNCHLSLRYCDEIMQAIIDTEEVSVRSLLCA